MPNEADRLIKATLDDYATSYWLGQALTAALKRDPVDAANDAERLAQLLKRRAQAVAASAQDAQDDAPRVRCAGCGEDMPEADDATAWSDYKADAEADDLATEAWCERCLRAQLGLDPLATTRSTGECLECESTLGTGVACLTCDAARAATKGGA